MGYIICYILSVLGLLITLIFGAIADAIPVIQFNWASIVADLGIVLMILPWGIIYLYNNLHKK